MNLTESILSTLESRWHQFAKRVKIDEPEKSWEAIATLHTSPERKYHNIEHIHDCLVKLDAWPNKPTAEVGDSIELAIWFHDIIFESTRADNEDYSAALLTHLLRGHPLETEAVALILATQHKEASGMRPEEIICDIDLSILGSPAAQYQSYADAIRQEYNWVESEIYRKKRSDVLRNFLLRENIYHTEHARAQWQDQALINLQNEIEQLESH